VSNKGRYPMISRILNSKWTWITAPFLSGFIIFLASTKALTPISSTEGKVFYEKLRGNLNTDTVIPWNRITPQHSGLRSYFWQLVYGYYSSNRFLTLQQLAPEFVTKTADQAVKPFLTS